MPELKGWKDIKLKQIYNYSCVPTGYEWLIYYNKLEETVFGIQDFQKEFDLGVYNSFGSVKDAINRKFDIKQKALQLFVQKVKVISYNTDKNGWLKRLKQIEKLLKSDIPCLLPIPVAGGDWHIEPVVKLENDEIWLLRENFGGFCKIDIVKLKYLRRYFLNEEGGNDLAWLER